MSYLRQGTKVRCKYFPGEYKVVYYIPKYSKHSKKEFRGKYCIILSSGASFYASKNELETI
jgi:hypothetical protein